MLLYTAELKLPSKMSWKDKVHKVGVIIQQLALTTCQNVRIGSVTQRGISGEVPELMMPCYFCSSVTLKAIEPWQVFNPLKLA
jgi:hypothetical protein